MTSKGLHHWIDTVQGVSALALLVQGEPIIALDTESDSFHHYREQVCLVQASVGGQEYLIDPLAVKDLSSLQEPLADPSREVVFNGADYDIVCLKRDFGIRFGRIFDTALGAQLLGYPSTGLSALLERHFGMKVSKQLQRDEWFRRPLTSEQIEYALNDVRFLIRLRDRIRQELIEAGRLEWAEEECGLLTRREWTREPFRADDFWRIRGSRDLARREQAILRELAVMRDQRARAMNRPAFKVISDHALIDLTRAKPRSSSGLRRIRGVSDLMIRRFGAEILAAIQLGLDVPERGLPVPPKGERRPSDAVANRRLEALKEWRRRRAEDLKLDPGVLAPLSMLRVLARSGVATIEDLLRNPDLSRWRIREFGAEWLEVMNPGS